VIESKTGPPRESGASGEIERCGAAGPLAASANAFTTVLLAT
jgi:hypothetical protein